MENSIVVDKTKCSHCGLCLKDCSLGCLEHDESDIPRYRSGGRDNCVACQHCMAVCPEAALSLNGIDPKTCIPFTRGNSDELLKMIKSRRSVRFYKNENIPIEQWEKIIEMLAYPPTGGNIDCLHYSIIANKEKMDEIRKVTFDKIIENDDPVPLMQMLKNAIQSGQDVIYHGAPAMIAVSIDKSRAVLGCDTVDPIIALSYLELYAHSLGLGTLWDDAAVIIANQIPESYALLQIPEGYTLSFIMLLGIPGIEYHRAVHKDMKHITIIQ